MIENCSNDQSLECIQICSDTVAFPAVLNVYDDLYTVDFCLLKKTVLDVNLMERPNVNWGGGGVDYKLTFSKEHNGFFFFREIFF